MRITQNPFKEGRYYNGIGPYLKNLFGGPVAKIAIAGGRTCPNRDGTKGVGGCIFCSENGSGDFAGDGSISIKEQIHIQASRMAEKWDADKYIIYFQSYTATYMPAEELRKKLYEALSYPGVVGIAVATRPDCLGNDILDLLSEINDKTYLWVELGLQTIKEETARLINRCYESDIYDEAVSALHARNIRVVTHLILGLPGETREDMLESVKHVASQNIFGIKLQLLHVLRGTKLSEMDYIPLEKEEYANLVAECLELLPPEMTVHRITGDGPKDILIEPLWSLDKKSVLNSINMKLNRSKSFQGRLFDREERAEADARAESLKSRGEDVSHE